MQIILPYSAKSIQHTQTLNVNTLKLLFFLKQNIQLFSLGIFIDSSLKWKKNIDYLANKFNKVVFQIRK